MSNMVRNKFAGLIRGLLGRSEPEKSSVEENSRPVSSAAPAGGKATSARSGAEASSAMSASETAAYASMPPGENEIALPLAPIIAGLPMDLRAKIMTVPPADAAINVPIETIVTQLAFGAVKISFGELRQMTTGVFANSGGELDSKQVTLPLNEILARINPALLGRRSGNKVDVSEDISGPFNNRCQGVVFTAQPLKPQTPRSTPPPAAPAEPASPFVSRREDPLPSAPIAFRPPSGMGYPKPPANGINGAKRSNGTNGSHGPGGPNGNGTVNRVPFPPSPAFQVPPKPPTPKLSTAPAPVPPTPVPAQAVPRPEPAQPTIFASLCDLSENWPEEVRDEITRSNLANVSVPLAGNLVDAGLKRGRLTMAWKDLRILARPSSSASPNDGLELELPLKVVAPLFLAARQKHPQARKTTNVSSEIPNLFFGFPQAVPEPAPKMRTPTTLPPPKTSSPSPRPLAQPSGIPKPAENRNGEGNTNFFVWGDEGETPRLEESEYAPPAVPQTDFTSRRALPRDVVAEAVKLPGVSGAVVALPDGLRVASEVIPGLNPDTLAAFIPQIYERMNQSTRELRMGVLNNIAFTVGNVPWKIFRVNSVYFAAFGQAGTSLPTAQLAQLAGELDRKKTQ